MSTEFLELEEATTNRKMATVRLNAMASFVLHDAISTLFPGCSEWNIFNHQARRPTDRRSAALARARLRPHIRWQRFESAIRGSKMVEKNTCIDWIWFSSSYQIQRYILLDDISNIISTIPLLDSRLWRLSDPWQRLIGDDGPTKREWHGWRQH